MVSLPKAFTLFDTNAVNKLLDTTVSSLQLINNLTGVVITRSTSAGGKSDDYYYYFLL